MFGPRFGLLAFLHPVRKEAHGRGEDQKGDVRQAGDQGETEQNAGDDPERPGVDGELALEFGAEVARPGGAGDEHARRGGDDQGRNLPDQPVADGENGVGRGGVPGGHALLQHADDEPGADVDHGNDDAGDGVALDELAGTVHRPVEVGLLGDFLASLARLVVADQAGVEVGVDRHLLARHGIQGEAGGDFGDPARPLGDDHEIDQHQDDEDDDADHVVAADHELAEGLDDAAGRPHPLVALEQDQAGRGDVEGEAKQGRRQQQGGKNGEIEGPHRVQGNDQDQQRQGDVEGQEEVQKQRRQRDDHQQQNHHQAERDNDVAAHQRFHPPFI